MTRRRAQRWPLAGLAVCCLAVAASSARAATTVGDATARWVEDRGPVAVLELDGNYDQRLSSGDVNGDPRQALAREFLASHPDEYDFLVIWTTFEFDTREARAFYLPVRNDTSGIGDDLFDDSAQYGSAHKLQGYIDMAALSRWTTDPLKPGFEETLTTLSHELLHRWGAHVRFKDADGALSSALLGREGDHWSFLLDTDASLLEGADWRDNGDGSFTSGAVTKFWSPLDLYLAGFYTPEQVPPFFLISADGVDPTQTPRSGVVVHGSKRLLGVADVIAAEGARQPSAVEAQKQFRIAFLVVKRTGEPVSDAHLQGIDRLRGLFANRFAALTGGRGSMEVGPAATTADPGAPTGIGGGGAPRGTPASLADAIAWLRAQQTADGYWQDTAETRLRDTVLALDTLSSLDPSFTGSASQARASSWLAAQVGGNSDFVARQLGALRQLTLGPTSAPLLALQNADGGWGVGAGYASDPLDTALAILALSAASPSVAESAAVTRGADYLVAAQGSAGGWGNVPGGPGHTTTSAVALQALRAAGRGGDASSRAIAWLATRQNGADGGFGDSPSTVHDTAQAMESLSRVQALGIVDAAGAAGYLSTRQTEAGSWDGSVYSTALAARALKRFSFPNWRFSGTATADPAAPLDGARVRISLQVINDGNATAPAGVLRLFDGDPHAGGQAAAADVALPVLAPNGSATVTVYWDSLDKPGAHTLHAVVDPDGAVAELSETDNQATIGVTVQPAPALADLELQPGDITFAPDPPTELPSELAISVTVRNLGHADAQAVVQLRRGSPSDGAVLGERTVTVPGRSSVAASFVDTLTVPGAMTYSAIADPANAVAEANEGNNAASRTVSTRPTVDLATAEADLAIEGPPYVGAQVTFRATVRNRGTADAPATVARFTVTDGSATRDLGRVPILLAAGASTVAALPWRVDLEGQLQLVVTVDPDAQVTESDESNNAGTLTFTTGQATQPNLLVRHQELTATPNPGLEGQPLALSAVVHNEGGQAANDVEVGFYEGDPANGGMLLGSLQVIPQLAVGAAATVGVNLPPLADGSSHLIFVAVDPSNHVAEQTEIDNTAFQTVSVLTLPDLAVTLASLRVTPAAPRPGEAVVVTVDVANFGQQGATNVAVHLVADGAAVGTDQMLASIPGGGSGRVSFPWTFPAAGGTVRLAATVDPANTIAEGSEANNGAERTVTGVDLSQPVVPRWFSPDGDGVQDTAAFGLPAPLPAGAAVEVRDLRARVLRRAAGLASDAAAWVWDGRDDAGRLVKDGDYTLVLRAADGTSLREGVVTVDTDHWPLLAVEGTALEKLTNLTCDLTAVGNLQFTGVDDRFYFTRNSYQVWAGLNGVYRGLPDGSAIERVLPNDGPTTLRVSKDGAWMALSDIEGWWGDKIYAHTDGSNATTIPIASQAGMSDFGFRGDSEDLVYLDASSTPAKIRSRPLDGSGTDRLVAPLPLTSGSTIYASFNQSSFSPDGRFLVFSACIYSGGCDYHWRLLELATGHVITLAGTFTQIWPSWSPDGRHLAIEQDVEDGYGTAVVVYDTNGQEERRFTAPREQLTALPAYAAYWDQAADTNVDVSVIENFPVSWSSTSEELVFGVRYYQTGDSHGWNFGRLLRANVITGGLDTIGWLAPNQLYSYVVATWDGSRWVDRGELHYSALYGEQRVDLRRWLPDGAGEYKVRLRQSGKHAAHVDRVQLRLGPDGAEQELPPTSAALGTTDVLPDVVRADHDVLDLHEREIEVRWSELPAGNKVLPLHLALLAREEGDEAARATPFRYPAEQDHNYDVRLGGGAPMVVDGAQTGADGLGEPLFVQWTLPDTGEPGAVVRGYVSSDASALYAALDFTVDNTPEDASDWASLWVQTSRGPRELRITAANRQWGTSGFTRTGIVHHRHRYYEWKVPFSELGVAPGETLALWFEAYGSAGQLAPTTFLPTYGESPLWIPGEDTVLFTEDGSGSTWAVPTDGGEPRRIFDHFTSLAGPTMSTSGHKLLFRDGRDILDPQSDCYNPQGESSVFSYESRANLTAELAGHPAEDGRGIVLEGAVADLHLARWRLEYAPENAPSLWTAIGPDETQPVFDAELTTWVPPAGGGYLVRLTVEDLAGNTRSVVRRFTAGAQTETTITDVSVSPRTISPNGDGVQDEATVRYRVLAPVHLELGVNDLAGHRLRTIRRDHATIGATYEITWDGRDERGLPVADGDYRVVLQSYAFTVTVDTTPPTVELELFGPSPPSVLQGDYVTAAPALKYKVTDVSDVQQRFDIGGPADPTVWREIVLHEDAVTPTGTYSSISLEQFVNHRFRVVATDAGGNRAVATTSLGDEGLLMERFGEDVGDGGLRGALEPVLLSGALRRPVARRALRFQLAESARQPLARVFVQYQMNGEAVWQEASVTQFLLPGENAFQSVIPDPRFELVWDPSALSGEITALRIHAIDVDDHELFSNVLHPTFLGTGINYRGRVKREDEHPSVYPSQAGRDALIAAHLDPEETTVLWATESVAEPLTGVTLFLTSPDDPRFATGVPLPLAAAVDGELFFDGRDLAPCKTYRGFVVARTAPATGAARDLTSTNGVEKLPCLVLDIALSVPAAACGVTPPSRTTATVTPRSLGGAALRSLTLALNDDHNVIANVNAPESGHAYELPIDTASLAEGDYPLLVALSDGEGAVERRRVRLIVDRSPPTLAITYPTDGQRVCAVVDPDTLEREVGIDADVADLGGVTCRYQSTLPPPAVGWTDPNVVCAPPPAAAADQPMRPLQHQEHHGLLFKAALAEGDRRLRLEVADRGGNMACQELAFTVDSGVEGAVLVGEPDFISPNGDGVQDSALLRLSAAEPLVATIAIYAGRKGLFDAIVPTGPVLRTLVAEQQLGGGIAVPWDGHGDGGATLPDGLYVAVASLRDGCGLTDSRSWALTLDTVPPSLAISAPQPGVTLPTLVEVRGSVSDPALLDYRVDWGAGDQPIAWAEISEGHDRVANGRLGMWNTYGLTGIHTVRLSARDLAGNSNQTLRTLDLGARQDLVSNLEAAPDLISPNGDGRREETALRFGLVVDARVRLEIATAAGAVVRTLIADGSLPAGAAVRPWDGKDDAGTALPDGEYWVRIHAIAAADATRTQDESVPVTLDRVAPEIVLLRPRNGFTSTAAGVVGTIRDLHLVDFTVSLTSNPSAPVWTEIARGTSSREDARLASLDGLAASGSYALLVKAVDGADNRSEQVVPFAIDDTTPVVALQTPAEGAVVGTAAGAVAVAGTIDEDHLRSWLLEVGAGSAPTAWTILASGSGAPPSTTLASWSPSGLADGAYTLRLTAEDEAGSTGTATRTVTVDNTPPVAILTAPAAGSYVTSSTAIIGTASDPHLLQYRLEVAPAGSNQWSELGRAALAVNGGLLLQWQALPPDGAVQLRLVVEDATGNVTAAAVAVTVDQHPPAAPQGLTARLENGRDAHLSWRANGEPDLAGYRVYREGVLVNASLVTNPELVDAGLLDGPLHYTVTAVDRAGLESPPSAAVEVLVDRTPPSALLHRPTAGSRVSGVVDVVVSATSTDLAEYRLWVGPGDASAERQLLRRSSVPVSYERVVQWSTLGLTEGAAYTLRLEAEDVHGNVAVAEAAVTIDNLPPATPTGLAASVAGADVTVTWTKNGEPDLLGYLLYRDGRLVNAGGPVVGDLRDLALRFDAASQARYLDQALPDGAFHYTLAAIDAAGNVSAPTGPVDATVERRAPHAVLVAPADGARFDREIYLLAGCQDHDVASVRLQFQAVADSAWTDVAAPDTTAPWEATWDASALPYGSYRLRAVATDAGGLTDPAPTAITVVHTDVERPAAPTGLQARVDGGDVQLTWTASTATDLRGYFIDRTAANGTTVRITAAAIATTTYVDNGRDDGLYAYTVVAVDTFDNESPPTAPRTAKVYTPDLDRPFTPTQALTTAVTGTVVPGAAVSLTRGGGTTLATTADAAGHFAVSEVALERGVNDITVTAQDGDGNRSKAAAARVTSGTPPSAPTGLAASVEAHDVHLSWDANPAAEAVVGYRPFRDGEPVLSEDSLSSFTSITASSSSAYSSPQYAFDGYNRSYWAPLTSATQPSAGQWLAARWAEPQLLSSVVINWSSYYYSAPAVDFDLEAWDGTGWLPVARVRDNEQDVTMVTLAAPYRTTGVRLVLRRILLDDSDVDAVTVGEMTLRYEPLVAATSYVDSTTDGHPTYTLTAVNELGFESALSAPLQVAVGDVTPPDPVTLSGAASGPGAHLTWTASGAADFLRYELYRDGERLIDFYDPATLAWDDAPLPNGTYHYTVRVSDQVGNTSAPSNEVSVTVAEALPAAPIALTVAGRPEGAALDLAWQPGSGGPAPVGYAVRRGAVAGGPYQQVGQTAGTNYRDVGLANGTTYYYVVTALDSAGNASVASNEASGTPQDLLAPLAPVLHFPGFPGLPFRNADTLLPKLVGSTEAGAAVTLLRSGESAAQITASGETTFERTGLYSYRPRPSPDGERLWLDSTYYHELYDFATGTAVTIPVVGSRVRWAAEGGWVAFVGYDSATGNDVLESYRVADGTVTPLAEVDWARVAVPAPGGRRVAFLGGNAGISGLFVVDIGSDARTRIGTASEYQIDEETLRWSPEGTRLAYVRMAPIRQLEIVTTATGAVQVLSQPPGPGAPSWSPDATSLVFTSAVDGRQQVWRYSVAGGSAVALTDDDANHAEPVWSADGQRVAFLRDRSVIVQDLGGGEQTHLYDATWPSLDNLGWTPGGRVFVADQREPVRITPAGRFELTNLALAVGDNPFTATARDAAGHLGPESLPMVVTVPTDELPDLAVGAADVVVLPAVPLVGGTATVSATVRNVGVAPTPASELTLALVKPDGTSQVIAERVAVPPLAGGGGAQPVSRQITVPNAPGQYRLVAQADPLDRVLETDEGNNRAEHAFVVTPTAAPVVFASTDRSSYASGETVTVHTAVVNGGATFSGSLEVAIEDADGALVETLPGVAIGPLAYGASEAHDLTWSTGDVFAGPYRVRVALVDGGGSAIATALAPFSIAPAALLTAAVETDRGGYARGSAVHVTGGVAYRDGNQPLTGVDVRLQVLAPDDAVLADVDRPLGTLLPQGDGTVTADWSSGSAAAGSYRVRAIAGRYGATLATAETIFTLTEGAPRVEGLLALADREPGLGATIAVTRTLFHRSGPALDSLVTRVRILDPVAGRDLASIAATADLVAGGTVSRTDDLDTTAWGLGSFLAVLEADLPAAGGGTQTIVLDAKSLTVVDATPPAAAIVAPATATLVGANPEAIVSARDHESRVRLVEIQLDGGGWLPIAGDGTSFYRQVLALLAGGHHTLAARATDAWGNVASAAAVGFDVDVTPPAIAVAGVEAGTSYDHPVQPTFTVTDDHLATVTALLDGEPFTSGTEVAASGSHALAIAAADTVGNRSSLTVPFTLGQPPILVAPMTVALVVDRDGDSQPSPGDDLEYQVSLRNDGTAAATGVVFFAARPAHTAVVAGSVTTTAGSVESESPVRVAVGPLAAGATATLRFRVIIELPLPAGVAAVSAQGMVTAGGGIVVPTDDPSLPGDADPTVIGVRAAPLLAALKTVSLLTDADGDAKPSPGDVLRYRVVIANQGNTGSTGGVFLDPVPAHVAVVPGSVTTSAGEVESESPPRVAIGELAGRAQVEVSLDVRIDATVPTGVTTISNQGTVQSSELPIVLTDDPDVAGAADPTVTVLNAAPRLTAELTAVLAVDADHDGMPSPGDTIEYTAAIVNRGNTGATVVRYIDAIPPHTALVAGSATTSRGTVTAESPLTVDVGELPAGETASVRVRVRVDKPIAPSVTTVSNQGTVASAERGPLLTDDPLVGGASDPTVTAITAAPVLSLTKRGILLEDTNHDGFPSPGEVVLYQLALTNTGNTAATDVELEDVLPAAAAFVPGSLQISQGTILGTSPIAVELGTVAVDAPATISLQVRIADDPKLRVFYNQATVTSHELAAVASDDPDSLEPGDPTRTPVGNLLFVDGFESGDLSAWSSHRGGHGDLAGKDGIVTAATVVGTATVLAAPATSIATDVDRSRSAQPALRIAPAEVTENAHQAARFAVTLDQPSDREVAVSYATADGSATAGKDYRPVAGQLVFPPGVVARTIAVVPLDDALLEPAEERFEVRLFAPRNAALAVATATGTIHDDELCLGPNLLRNGGAEEPLAGGRIRDWQVTSGAWSEWRRDAATTGGDCFAPLGNAAAELTQEIDLAPFAAAIADGNQVFDLELSLRGEARAVFDFLDGDGGGVLDSYDTGPRGGSGSWQSIAEPHVVPLGSSRLRVRLLGNGASKDACFDAIAVRPLRVPVLLVADGFAREGKSGEEIPLRFDATLSCPYWRDVELAYATTDGTAHAEDDYRSTAGTLTLPAGATAAVVAVPLRGDEHDEGHESFRLDLEARGDSGAVLLTPRATGVIANDDACPLSAATWQRTPARWPAAPLRLGGRDVDTRALAALLSAPAGDAVSALGRQLATTELNLLAGTPPDILPAVDAASALLARLLDGAPTAAEKARAERLAASLRAYNEAGCQGPAEAP